jgi:hypothetical protein
MSDFRQEVLDVIPGLRLILEQEANLLIMRTVEKISPIAASYWQESDHAEDIKNAAQKALDRIESEYQLHMR